MGIKNKAGSGTKSFLSIRTADSSTLLIMMRGCILKPWFVIGMIMGILSRPAHFYRPQNVITWRLQLDRSVISHLFEWIANKPGFSG